MVRKRNGILKRQAPVPKDNYDKRCKNSGADVYKGHSTKYKDHMCKFVEQFLGEGHSKSALIAALGISFPTLYEWEKKFPEFAVAMEHGMNKCQKWWEDKARDQFNNGNFIPGTFAFIMQNRFNYNNGTTNIRTKEEIYSHNLDEKKITIDVKEAPDERFGKVLDILLEAGAIPSQIEGSSNTEDDKIYTPCSD